MMLTPFSYCRLAADLIDFQGSGAFCDGGGNDGGLLLGIGGLGALDFEGVGYF